MDKAIALSCNNNKGGPFGAVIVDDSGNIVGQGSNEVTSTMDPTAHAEVVAIRQACANKNNFVLDDCIIYSSCEPCPMCLSAIYWARIKKIYFANTREDAKEIGFDDSFIYDEIVKPPNTRQIEAIHEPNKTAKEIFTNWFHSKNKIAY